MKEKESNICAYPDCPDCRVRRLTAQIDRQIYFAFGFAGAAAAFALWWTGAWRAVLVWFAWVSR